MKKHLLLSLVVLLGITTLNARPIDAGRAKTVGQKFVQANFTSNSRNSELQLVYTGASTRGEVCFYAFNAGDSGFVIDNSGNSVTSRGKGKAGASFMNFLHAGNICAILMESASVLDREGTAWEST